MKLGVFSIAPHEFPALEPEWNSLALPLRQPTLSHQWVQAMLSALMPGDTPFILALRDKQGRLQAGGALVREAGSRYLRFLSNYAVPEPGYIIASNSNAQRQLFKAMRRLGHPLELTRIPFELFDQNELGASLGGGALRLIRPEGGSPWLPLEGTIEGFEQGLSATRRSDLRRARRKAEALGTVSSSLIQATQATAPTFLARYIELERHSWKYEAGSAILLDRKAHRFFSALTASTLPLVFGFLTIDETVVAGQIMIDYADTLWVLKTAFHKDFRSCSPGVLLMHEAVSYGLSKQRYAFEFLGFDEPWLRLWSQGMREYKTLKIYTYSRRGIAELCRDGVALITRRLKPTPIPLPAQ